MPNELLERAAHQRPAITTRGAMERIFTLMFQGFVYSQIWEDPGVDLDALALKPHHRIVTIASGGCNVLNYLTADPASIVAVDLNPHHVALTRLKLAALRHLPDHESFFRFFGAADDTANLEAFADHLSTQLDEESRAYWNGKAGPLSPRRIEMSARNLYRHGLLGRFIGILHTVARLHGKKLNAILDAKNPREQRAAFDATIAPLFESPAIRLLARSFHRYVLLDSQDWMNAAQLAALWAQIDRTADARDAKVIFRTAGAESPLEACLPADLLAPWLYHEWQSRVLHAQDRSSIYGGFHVYARRALH